MQTNEAGTDLIRLNISATAIDTALMLVVLFVAALFGVSLSLIIYGLMFVASLSVYDLWWRVRNTIKQEISRTHTLKFGIIEDIRRENEELRQQLLLTQQREEIVNRALNVKPVERKPVVVPVVEPKNFIRYNPSADDQAIINNALLIHQQWLLGSHSNSPVNLWSRERMEQDGHLTQPQWNDAKRWLMAVGVLEYKNRSTAIWKIEDRRQVKFLLMQYAERIHPAVSG